MTQRTFLPITDVKIEFALYPNLHNCNALLVLCVVI